MMRLQFGLGQAIRCDELLHMSKQLHGHRTYFFPGGAFRIGCAKPRMEEVRARESVVRDIEIQGVFSFFSNNFELAR